MKQISFFAGLYFTSLLFQGCSEEPAKATGLPGDHLDLYAVLDLFKSSSSIEKFEKSLNDKSNGVNNLDLDGDGKVDYIRVIDKHDADAHAIILRVPVTSEESQDIAVIEIEKTGDKTASIQVIGDEEIYGKDVIIEPKEGSEKAGFIYETSIGVNVWFWPSVSYVYMPEYVVWVSPYYYDYYPVYWSPWPPIAYEVYHPMFFKNHGQYVSYNKRRFKHAHEMYYSDRMYSGFVMGRKKNGDFKEGKQEKFKGNKPSKGNGGNEKQDGGGNQKHDGSGNQKQDGGGNQKQDGGGNEKHNDANKKMEKGADGSKGKDMNKDGPKNSVNTEKKGGNDKGSAPKSNTPKGSNQKQKGGGSPKGGKK